MDSMRSAEKEGEGEKDSDRQFKVKYRAEQVELSLHGYRN